MRRIFAAGVFVLLSAASAEQGWVTNRGGTTISAFDPVTNTELSGSPLTTGSAPVDIAADQPDGGIPNLLFVANSGSNTVSVVNAFGLVKIRDVGSDAVFGNLLNPSGIVRMPNSAIAVVDEQVVASGKSTVRFLDPATGFIIDGMYDPDPSSRYVDVVATSNGRLWIADDGYNGVVVLHLNLFPGPPFDAGIPREIQYSGPFDYADVIYDTVNPTPAFLVNPQRLSTNGIDRVVVADTGSDVVTILDANFSAGAASSSILFNVDLGLAAGKTCVDARVAGTKVYVTTTDAAMPVVVLSLTSGTVLTTVAGIATTVGGIGRSLDSSKVYVGGGSGLGTIYVIDTTTDTVTATIAGFSGGSFPFAFVFAPDLGPPGEGQGGGGCGMVGLDALLILALLGLRRQSRRESQKESSSAPQ